MSEKNTVNERKQIRVVIADDHPLVRSGLRLLLSSHDEIELVGEAANGEEAVQICMRTDPDIVLMDMVMQKMDGIESTKAILKVCPNVQVIALTSFYDRKLVKSAFAAGVVGYILKDISGDNLVNAVISAYGGHPPLSPEATKALISCATQPEEEAYGLTRREMQILEMMIDGLNNTQIAEKLFVSRSTVKSQVSSILSKLGVHSRVEAVSLALQNNILNHNS